MGVNGGGRVERIGIFGGTFDPPHNAHVALAHAACDALGLDQLRWIPAGQPWQQHATLVLETWKPDGSLVDQVYRMRGAH